MKQLLIIGMGNNILTDSGIGPRLVNDLKKQLRFSGISEFKTYNTGSPELVMEMTGYKQVFILDVLKTGNYLPGNVSFYDINGYTSSFYLNNVHDFSFKQSLRLVNQLGLEVTNDIYVIVIEIKENMEFSESLSVELEIDYQSILNETKFIIENQIMKNAPSNPL